MLADSPKSFACSQARSIACACLMLVSADSVARRPINAASH